MDQHWRSDLPCDVETDCPEEPTPRVPTLGLHMSKHLIDQDYVDGALGKERVDSMFDSGLDSINSMGCLRSQSQDMSDSELGHAQTKLDSLSLDQHFPSTDLTQTHSLHSDVRYSSLLDEGFESGRGLSLLSEDPAQFSDFQSDFQSETPVVETQDQKDKDEKIIQIFTKDEDGDTQLHMAIIHGHSSIAMEMIDLAPDHEYLNIKNDLHQTPLHLAVCTRQAHVTRKLVSRGVQVDLRDRHGNTALHIACQNGDRDCVKALTRPISHQELRESPYTFPFQRIPQDPEIKNYEGETCLHLAAKGAHLEVLAHLISRQFGSDINARDGRSGRTALHHAVEDRNLQTLALFLRLSNVDVNVRTFDGSTSLKLALGRGYQDIAQALVMRGARDLPVNADSDSDSNYDSDEESMDTKYDDIQIGGQPVAMS